MCIHEQYGLGSAEKDDAFWHVRCKSGRGRRWLRSNDSLKSAVSFLLDSCCQKFFINLQLFPIFNSPLDDRKKVIILKLCIFSWEYSAYINLVSPCGCRYFYLKLCAVEFHAAQTMCTRLQLRLQLLCFACTLTQTVHFVSKIPTDANLALESSVLTHNTQGKI